MVVLGIATTPHLLKIQLLNLLIAIGWVWSGNVTTGFRLVSSGRWRIFSQELVQRSGITAEVTMRVADICCDDSGELR